LLGFPAAKAALVDEIRKLLLHQVVNHSDGLLEAIFVCACNVKVKRRALK
jgi:hypothetical protein